METLWIFGYLAIGIFASWLMNWLFPNTPRSTDEAANEAMGYIVMMILWPIMAPIMLIEYAWKKAKKNPYVR